MKTDLRLTDTNSASDSKGRTWGLEGNLFWYIVAGLAAGITIFFVLIVVVKAGILTSFAVAVGPVLFCLAYIFGLRQGKPTGCRSFGSKVLARAYLKCACMAMWVRTACWKLPQI